MNVSLGYAPSHMKTVVAALQSLRGVAKITAITLAVEVGSVRRFERATQLMSYTGMVPSERSSGARERRGAITKAGKQPPTTRPHRSRTPLSTPTPAQRATTRPAARAQRLHVGPPLRLLTRLGEALQGVSKLFLRHSTFGDSDHRCVQELARIVHIPAVDP